MANQTMEELLKTYGSRVKGFTKSQKVDARVVEINKKQAIFDVGGKSEGVLRDIYFQEARDFLKTLKVGDTVSALVMDPETSDGVVLISLRHAASDSLWERLKDLKSKGSIVQVSVRNTNQSGVAVEYEGVSGFIPSSQIGKVLLKKIEGLEGTIKVKIVEIDKARKKIVFSEKAVSEAAEIEEINKAIKKLKTGEIMEGVISTITNFGLFVELTIEKIKIEGLVHLSETSWDKGGRMEDVFKVGQKVEVKVLEVKEGRIALSIKQATSDPWDTIADKYKVEDKVKGKVVRNSDFGTFIELEPGIEGLVHITKIPPATKLTVGDSVNVNIEELDAKAKKISLGLVLSTIPLGYK